MYTTRLKAISQYATPENGSFKVEPGDKISADLVTTSDGNDYWLEDIRIVNSTGRKP